MDTKVLLPQTTKYGFIFSSLSQGLIIGLNFITSIIFTRILGVEGRGIYALLFSLMSILLVFIIFGLPSSNAYFVAKNNNLLPYLLGNSLLVVILFVVVIIPLFWTNTQFFLLLGVPTSEILVARIFLSISLPLGFLSALLRDIILGKRLYIQYSLMNLLSTIMFLIIGLVLCYVLPNKLAAILISNALSNIIPIILCLVILFPQQRVSISIPILINCFKYSIRVHIVTIITTFYLQVNTLLINKMLGVYSTGIFSIIFNLAFLTVNIPNAIVPVIFSRTASDTNNKYEFTLASSRLFFSIAFISLVLLNCFSGLLLSLYGDEYKQGVIPLLFLTPGMLAYSVVIAVRGYFMGIGYPKKAILIPIIGLIINLVINYFLVPIWFINGASLGISISFFVMLLVTFIFFKKDYSKLRFTDFFALKVIEVSGYFNLLRKIIFGIKMI